jgi:hypothetical protein
MLNVIMLCVVMLNVVVPLVIHSYDFNWPYLQIPDLAENVGQRLSGNASDEEKKFYSINNWHEKE